MLSQVLTLYIIPVVYVYMDRLQAFLGRKKAPVAKQAVEVVS
jgi:hypothetical protein